MSEKIITLNEGAIKNEGIIYTDITEIWNNAVPEMIMAADETAAIAVYNNTVQQMKDAGLQQYLDAVAPNYYQKKELMGIK
ncbi:MAG: hypothetical protein VB070_06215 [Clostridiaceae bacterium]|nr:hypothetical protein [Clostridiaceae bacterium]